MNERHAQLMAGYLDGALSDAERDELLQALQADAALAAALAAELEIHRTLQFTASGGPGEDRRSADRILQFVRATLDGPNFLERVKDRAREESSPGKKTSRRLYLPRRRTPSRQSYAVPVAVAASLFVVFLLIVSFATSGKPPYTAKESPRKTEPRETKETPAPAPAPEERKPVLEREKPPVAPDRPKTTEVPKEERRPEPAPPQAPTPPKTDERPAPVPVPVPAPAPTPAKTETKAVLALATLERMDGDVIVLDGSKRSSGKVGRALMPGEGIETRGANARAFLALADGTRLELGGGGIVREIRDREGTGETGIWIDLSGQGFLAAQVKKQPEGRAFVIASPHGEMRVLGTTLRVIVESSGTRLEVTEGHVRLTRKSDGKTVDVLSGHYAVAATGVSEPEPVSRAIPPEVITVNFGPDGLTLPEGVLNDSGEEFDPKRGYGWKGPKVGRDVEQPYPDPNNPGKNMVWKAGRNPGNWAKGIDVMHTSYVAAGSIKHDETWIMPLPNGRYLITVCVGGGPYKQGPHHVNVEGIQIINRGFTRIGENLDAKDMAVEVKDGELTMTVGFSQFTGVRPTDPSTDTILNYIVIKKAKAK